MKKVIIIITTLFVTSCSNDEVSENQIEENEITTALLWKNGQISIDLVNGSTANAVFLGN